MRRIQLKEDDVYAASGGDPASSSNTQSNHFVALKPSNLIHPVIQRSGRDPPASTHNFEQTLSSSKGGGSALPDTTKQYMESRFQADFGNVRIHTGTTAQSLSSNIHAQAFTHGNDIYFNSGKYSPHTASGGTLLAHELTHTIQQGASKSNTANAPPAVARKSIIQRTAQDRPVPTQLNNAVAKAKAEQGKVNADKDGDDGFRTGWPRLVEYFKTTLGEDKVIPEGGAYVKGGVSEQDIKKKKTVKGLPPADPRPANGPYMRDAMPSWCGIFVFWALHKGGVPMKKWILGGQNVDLNAAYPVGYVPKAGDIAYRSQFSHFAIVASASGDTVTTINGNTSGEDNLGAQVQSKDHPISKWTAFFDPLMMKDGELGSSEPTADADAKPKTLKELRQELFHVNKKEETEETAENNEAEQVQTKSELSSWGVNANGALVNNTVQPQAADTDKLQSKEEEHKKEEDTLAQSHEHAVQKKDSMDSDVANDEQIQPKSLSNNISQTNTSILAASCNSATGCPAIQKQEEGMESDRGPPVQLKAENGIIQCSWLDSALLVVNSAVDYVSQGLEAGKRLLLGQARDFAMAIPGYRALRVVLGEDPITSENVDRNGHNFIEAAFDIMPGGELLHQKLEELGALTEAESWVDTQIATVEGIVRSVITSIENFWNGLTLTDLGSPHQVFERIGNIIHNTIQSVIDFAVTAGTQLLSIVKRFLLDQLVSFIREHTTAYPLLTVILEEDPVTEQHVDRNGTNILNAMLELAGEEGRQQRAQMQDTGSFKKVADWIDKGIAIFSSAYQQIRTGISNIWDFVSIESLMHPIDTFNRIYDTFATPIQQVWDFVRDTAITILRFIKEVLMRRLSTWARTVRGYALVTVIIGKDPFTDQVVPRTMENIIRGFMSLIDGGEQQFEQLKQSGAIERTTQRILAAVDRLNMTPAAIVQLFIDLWHSFSLNDLIHPIDAFRRILARFGEPIGRLIAFIVEIIRIVIEVILQVMNFPSDLIANIINKAMLAIDLIKRDPVGFLKNLLRAIKEGFMQFFDNIGRHLLNGLTGWLLSELQDAGVTAPTDFSLRGIIGWVLQILGITMEKIWEKLSQKLGPERVARIRRTIDTLEGIWTFIRDVQQRGIAAIWDKIQEKLSDLWNTVLDAVKKWVMDQIVNKVIEKLLSMLDPTGIMAVINSAIALYRAIQSFIRYLRQMLEVVNSFVEGVVEIASGNTKRAADFLENSLDRAMPVVIGFLANQVGLSGVGHRVGELIESARAMVDQALDWLIDKAISIGGRLLEMGRAAVGRLAELVGLRKQFTTADGNSHSLYFDESSGAVMVASTPKTLEVLANERKTQLQQENTATPAKVAENQPKIQAADDILRIKSEIDPLITQYGDAVDRSSASQANQLKDQINTKALSIVEKLIIAGIDAEGSNNVQSHVDHITDGMNRPMMVLAQPLTTIPGNTAGSTPQQDPLGWDSLNPAIRRNSWVAAHLLNHNLHGPGLQWNLVSGTKETNNNMKTEIENTAKDQVSSNPGKMYYYEVSVTYYGDQPAKPYVKFFPFQINVQFGELTGNAGAYVRGPATGRNFTQDSPDVTNTVMPSFNESSATRLKDASDAAGKSIPGVVFERIVAARRTIPAQSFGDSAASMVAIMDTYYVNNGFGAAGFFTTRFGADLQALATTSIFMNYA